MSEEGGTKLRNRNVPQQMGGGMPPQMGQQMGQMPPQMNQQMNQMGQQMGPQMGQQMGPQMRATPQQAPPPQMYQQQMAQEEAPQLPKSVLKKTKYGPFSINNKNIRNGVIVVVIFILLNSKIIWRALSKMPMMGQFEPSIIALIVNSILAGVVFYFTSTKLNKN